MPNDNDGNESLARPVSGPRLLPYDNYDPYRYPAEYVFEAGARRHLRDYWHMVLFRKWIVLACVALALAYAAFHTTRQTPLYEATAQLEIDQQSDNILPYQQMMQTDYGYMYEEYLQTQIKHLTSRSLAARVAVAAGLDREDLGEVTAKEKKSPLFSPRAWVKSLIGSKQAPGQARPPTREELLEQGIDQVLGGLRVTPVRNSRVVEVSYISPNPELSAKIANLVCAEFIEYNFQAKYNATSRATEFLQKQLVDLKAKVEKSESDLLGYARRHSIVSVGEKQDVVTQALADINAKLTEARAARMEKESVYRTLSTATTEDFPLALRTKMIEDIESNLLKDEQELAKLTAQYGPAMPQVKQLESRIRRAKKQLERERQLAIENARTEFETAAAKEKLLLAEFDRQKALADQLNESQVQYNIMKREVETSKQLYDGLLQRMKEAGVAAGLKSGNIRVVDPAPVPASATNPSMAKNLAIALLVGLLGGLGSVFFLNYLDTSIRTPEDAENAVGVIGLGLIPSLSSSHRSYGYLKWPKRHMKALPQQRVELAMLTSGSSLIAEAFRGLRAALLLSNPDNPPRVIMITSPRSSEGKTTAVCNTALSLAQIGKKVLILDCDMHRPKIGKIFNQAGHGLSEYLTGQIEFADVVQETTIPNLSIAHSGTPPPNPGELLGSLRMNDAIQAASEVFDHIIIDTPPLMSVTDALILAPMSDGVILVVSSAKNPPEVLKRAKKSLDLVRANILGVLCNNVDLHSSRYHYYYHQYAEYSSYVSEDETHPPL